MQILHPMAFKELVPSNVWWALIEMSNFFKEFISTVIQEKNILRLNEAIPLVMYKIGHLFLSRFSDSMEHLPVHLAYKA